MRNLLAFYFLLYLMLLCGCAIHKPVPGHLNYYVDGKASHMSMKMLNCDKASPPHCEKRVVTYDLGAERLDLRKP